MNYESYKEIHSSYLEMKKTISVVKEHETEILDFFKDKKECILLGCGSSYWASMSVARSFLAHTEKKVIALKAAEVTLAPEEYVKGYEQPTLLIPSRSGESKELLEAIAYFKKEYPELKIFAITEFTQNSLKGIADFHIALPFVEEISVCQTRSFNCLYTAMMVIVSFLSNRQILQDFEDYLKHAPTYYQQVDQKIKKMIDTMEHSKIVALGTGIQYGASIEGAYIIMEMAQHLTNYFQTLEYRHGPIVTADYNTWAFIIVSKPEYLEREVQMGREIRKQGAKVVLCGCDHMVDGVDEQFMIPTYCEEVRGIFATMILQHLAYYLALKLNRNPDKPGDLVKFITY